MAGTPGPSPEATTCRSPRWRGTRPHLTQLSVFLLQPHRPGYPCRDRRCPPACLQRCCIREPLTEAGGCVSSSAPPEELVGLAGKAPAKATALTVTRRLPSVLPRAAPRETNWELRKCWKVACTPLPSVCTVPGEGELRAHKAAERTGGWRCRLSGGSALVGIAGNNGVYCQTWKKKTGQAAQKFLISKSKELGYKLFLPSVF